MKDTQKLRLINIAITIVLLLLVCFGCSRNQVDYVHSVNGCDVYYVETDSPEYVEKVAERLMILSDNFVLQSDFGIIEVEDGEIVYNNTIK